MLLPVQLRGNRRYKFMYVADAATPGVRTTSVKVKRLLEIGAPQAPGPKPREHSDSRRSRGLSENAKLDSISDTDMLGHGLMLARVSDSFANDDTKRE